MDQEPSLEEKLAVASAFILQSPPGEVNDVFNDVRPIVGDDAELESGLLPALSQYNTEQLTLVELPNAKTPAMICAAAKVGADGVNRFLDPNSSQTFVFDHLRLAATEVEPFTAPADSIENTRSQLSEEAEKYVKEHFPGGVWSVFAIRDLDQQAPAPESSHANQDSPKLDPTSASTEKEVEEADGDEGETREAKCQDDKALQEPPNPADDSQALVEDKQVTFQLYIVGNKYNPGNYWTGRWRSVYDIDASSGTIRGQIQVNVHYYEQGNVQLTTLHKPVIELASRPATASQIIKAISEAESAYQTAVNLAYMELGDNTFKQLRRALPLTKQKIDWNNIKTKIVLNDKAS
ncbi:hypothetical protein CROQUDRAFT_657496 [Cronartium quercuum f. sp. fusiforme G11]|uniref:F-actin-capping protein subunit alpha n=1 Tax=Cronartium quercuum f. sp. fusiforme G11 TaxID=708437 RepID=A0A9P6TC38_9BASI|nr:hypothetical protein CROQUDRAFT_657496 [Cronartium quercuum f. sp. fusiforme G11]